MPDRQRDGDAGSSTHRRLAFAVAGGVVAADQIAKQLASRLLPEDRPVHIVGGIHLQLFRNFAGPGGHWAGHTVAISVFTVVAAIALAVVIARSRLDRFTAIALGLFLGGAIGNGLDRLLRGPSPLHGGVVDWLALNTNGASMNLADLSLNAAVVVLITAALISLLPKKKRRPGIDPDAAA